MPPNIKRPLNLPIGDELLAVRQFGSQTAPPPLTTLEHNTDSDDEAFFLRDIEENIHVESNWSSHPVVESNSEEVGSNEHRHAHRVIRHLASQISDEEELNNDEKRLFQAVRDAGEFSYGVIATEVWLLEDDKLIRPKGGWWHNNKLHENNHELLTSLASEQPSPMMPGVDAPGILWAESHHDGNDLPISRSSSFFLRDGHRSSDGLEQQHPQGISTVNSSCSKNNGIFGGSMNDLAATLHLHTSTANPHALLWRDLLSIAKDPDSPKTPRLGQLIQAGLRAAATVPFHIKGSHHSSKGLVIYFARCHTRTHLLSNVANDAYLRASAQMIGHAAALSETRRASVEARRRQNSLAADRFKKNLLDFRKHNHGPHKADFVSPPSDEDGPGRRLKDRIAAEDFSVGGPHCWERAHHRISTWRHKCLGGNLQVPPALSFRQTLWTILGAFCGLFVLSSLNEYYKILSDEDYFLLIGPFGALMTLQYGLTAAPASQPRNAILGQAVSGAVSLAFTYIPESILATWVRQAVGPAFAIGTMVKLGVTHPPAGAHAVLYASGKYNFGFYALVILSSAISVIPATIVNNLSSKRQYPTYWAMIQRPEFPRETKKAEE